ncbi:hypothetical protein [Mesorhizobium onobrychidis]|uniref:SGNH/GDSL hydrolase family protein n=1 Tax=Mesorhizobium onobrychidis TaxID=2775404 RepID=A0ABY5QX04_9HYPH|nr:hypothetical protein [Mesorhizobium onobrychidis]UVC14714.1 hypothetical protein IHQ72_29545 [Mesorhizobium onobrychidis]
MAYFDRLNTQPTAPRQAIYDTLLRGLVSAGIFAKLDALYILRTARAQWAYENLVQPAYRLTPNGGYTFTADEGWAGNGTTGYLITDLRPSFTNGRFTLNDANFFVYSRTNATTTGVVMGSRSLSTVGQTFLTPRNAGNLATFRINQDANGVSAASASSDGLLMLRRSGSTAYAFVRNGVVVGSDTTVSTSLSTSALTIGALYTNGVAASFNSYQFAAAGIGASLTDAEALALKTLLDAFFAALTAEAGAGGSDPVVTPSYTTYVYGDSLTSSALITQLTTQLSRPVTSRGIGSQRSSQIAMRQGGVVPTVTISGDQIVAGANSITHFNGTAIVDTATNPNAPQLLSTPGDNSSRSISASIAGVLGSIARTASGGPPSTTETYTFTPTADPGTVACPAGTDVIVQTKIDAASTQVIWSGRNNKGINNWSVVSDVQGMVDLLSTVDKHYVVMSILNGDYADERAGQSEYINLMASNAELEAAFPGSYLDVRRYLIDDGLTDAAITPTAQDLIDIADDTVPASLRADNIHLTTVGYELVADHVAAFMLAKGW